MKVTVVGAGKYGSTTVQRIAEKGLADEVVMTDIVEGLPQGLALDMNQSRPIEGFETRIVGSNGYEESAGSDVCVITAGLEAMTLGSHGDTMVPVPSLVKVDGRALTELADAATIERVVQRTRDGGGEIVALLKAGSAYYAPSSAAAAMVEAVLSDSGALMPVCAWVTGQYGIDGVYLGVPARLGRGGVREVVELPLTEAELANLREAAEAVRAKQADAIKLV